MVLYSIICDMLWIELNNIQINEMEKNNQGASLIKQKLNELKHTIIPTEKINDWIYLWKEWTFLVKDEVWKVYKSVFSNGKWRWEKPAKFTSIYDLAWKEYIRAREWEKNWEAFGIQQNAQQSAIKNPIEDTELIAYLKEQNIIPDIKNSTVYYIPVEDGKWHIVKYEAMYIKNDSPSEIIQFPIKDIHGNVLRFQTIERVIGLQRPLVDPIDFVSLGWGIRMSFAKWLTTLAPKAWINLSKIAIRQISKGGLFLNVLWKNISQDVFRWFLQNALDD